MSFHALLGDKNLDAMPFPDPHVSTARNLIQPTVIEQLLCAGPSAELGLQR